MAVATIDAAGQPDVRTVLMNARDHRGFVFFTNFDSGKGEQLLANPRAALVFHWKSSRRQVRARGPVEIVEPGEADAYFASRSRVSQLGAHASRQSRPLQRKAILMEAVDTLKSSLGEEDPVARPAYWSGFRIIPLELEFLAGWAVPAARSRPFHPRGAGCCVDLPAALPELSPPAPPREIVDQGLAARVMMENNRRGRG